MRRKSISDGSRRMSARTAVDLRTGATDTNDERHAIDERLKQGPTWRRGGIERGEARRARSVRTTDTTENGAHQRNSMRPRATHHKVSRGTRGCAGSCGFLLLGEPR